MGGVLVVGSCFGRGDVPERPETTSSCLVVPPPFRKPRQKSITTEECRSGTSGNEDLGSAMVVVVKVVLLVAVVVMGMVGLVVVVA